MYGNQFGRPPGAMPMGQPGMPQRPMGPPMGAPQGMPPQGMPPGMAPQGPPQGQGMGMPGGMGQPQLSREEISKMLGTMLQRGGGGY